MLPPPSQIIGGWGAGPPLPTPMYKNPELPMIAMQTQEICEGWCKSLLISDPRYIYMVRNPINHFNCPF